MSTQLPNSDAEAAAASDEFDHPAQDELPVPFGEIAVALGYCTEENVRSALSQQRGTGGLVGRGIGYVLVQLGLLDTRQRDEILAYQRVQFRRFSPTADSRRGDERLGRLVTERGLVSYADFVRALEAQGELRDVDGNTPPLGKVFVELRLLSEKALAELLESVGVEVYACEACKEAFNVVGGQDTQRRRCCPLCHANQVRKAPEHVLDVVGTLQLGRPLVEFEAEEPADSSGSKSADAAAATDSSAEQGSSSLEASADEGSRSSAVALAPSDPTPSSTHDAAPATTTEEESEAEGSRAEGSRSKRPSGTHDTPRRGVSSRVSLPVAPGSPPTPPPMRQPTQPPSPPTPKADVPSHEPENVEAELRKAADSSLLNLAEDLGIDPEHGAGETAMLGVRLDAGTTPRASSQRHSERLYDDRPPTPGSAKRRITSSTLATALRTIGPFRVLDEIGRGEFGIVFHAQHTQTNEEVALRVLLGELARDTNYLMRLERQAGTLRRLQYPGIAHLVATGRVGDLVYVATRFVKGKTLDEWVRVAQPTLLERLELLVTLSEALAFAHDHNVLHLRLSPREILVDDEGQPWITDFGLLQPIALDDDTPASGLGSLETAMRRRRIRRAGRAALVGPAGYLAPEQLRTADNLVLDGRADEFSLAVIGYELVSAVHPFITGANADIVDVLKCVLEEDPPALKHLVSELPEGLENVLAKGLEKKRDTRYETCLFFAADLRRVMQGEPVEAPSPHGFNKLRRYVRRNPVVASVLMVLVALSLAVYVVWALDQTRVSDEPRPPEAHAEHEQEQLERTLHPLDRALAAGDVREAGRFIALLPPLPERTALDWQRLAHYEFLRGRHGDALDAAQTAAEFAGDVDALLLLGELAQRSEVEEVAREAYQRAGELAGPEAPEPVLAEARLLRHHSRFSEMRSLLEPALARMPDEPELRAHYALALGRTGAAASALRRIERSLDEFDEPAVRAAFYRERALILSYPEYEEFGRDSLRQAEADLLLALEANPALPGTLSALAQTRRAQIRLQLEQGPAFSLGNPGGAVQRAQLMLELGHAGATQAELATFVERLGSGTPAELAAQYGLALARIGEMRLARHVFDALEARLAPHGSEVLDGARLAAYLPGPSGGIEPSVPRDELVALAHAAQRYTQRRPGEVAGWLWRARLALALDDAAGAQAALYRARHVARENDPRVNYMAGLAAWHTGRLREARRRFEAALDGLARPEQAAASVAAAVQLGKLDLAEGGDAAAALEHLAELAQRLPDPLEAGLARCRILLARGSHDFAATQLEHIHRALQRRSERTRLGNEVQWLLQLGEMNRTLGRFGEASNAYVDVLELDRYQRRATRELFFLAQSTERFSVSLAQLRRYRDEEPHSLVFAELEARHLARQDAEAARERFRTLEGTPSFVTRLTGQLNERHAAAHARAASRAAAEASLWRRILAAPGRDYPLWLVPRSATDATELAEALLRHGDANAALVQLDVSLPEELHTARSRRIRGHALTHLGAISAARDEWATLLDQFVGYDPVLRADDLASAALVELELGDFRRAAELAEDANRQVGARPRSVTALRVLAHLAERENDTDAATRHWRRAAERGGGSGAGARRPQPPDQPVEALADYALLEYLAAAFARSNHGGNGDDDRASQAWHAALELLESISSGRHRGHGGGHLQQLLLTLGVARLETQPVLARDALAAAADWPVAQADGAPHSGHGRTARLLLALKRDPTLLAATAHGPTSSTTAAATTTTGATTQPQQQAAANAWRELNRLAAPAGVVPEWRRAEAFLAAYQHLGRNAALTHATQAADAGRAPSSPRVTNYVQAWQAYSTTTDARDRLALLAALAEVYGPDPATAAERLGTLSRQAAAARESETVARLASLGAALATVRAGDPATAKRRLHALANQVDASRLPLHLCRSLELVTVWAQLKAGKSAAAYERISQVRVEPQDPFHEVLLGWRLVAAAHSGDETAVQSVLNEIARQGRTPPSWLAAPHVTVRLVRAVLEGNATASSGSPWPTATTTWHAATNATPAQREQRRRDAARLITAAERAGLAPLLALQLRAQAALAAGALDEAAAYVAQAQRLDPSSPVTRRLDALHAYYAAERAARAAGYPAHAVAALATLQGGNTADAQAAQQALAEAQNKAADATRKLAAAAEATDDPSLVAVLTSKRLRLQSRPHAALEILHAVPRPTSTSGHAWKPQEQRALLAEMLRNVAALPDSFSARIWLDRILEAPPLAAGSKTTVPPHAGPFADAFAARMQLAAQASHWHLAEADLATWRRLTGLPSEAGADDAALEQGDVATLAATRAGPAQAWQSYLAVQRLLEARGGSAAARSRTMTQHVERAEQALAAAAAAHQAAANGNGSDDPAYYTATQLRKLAAREHWWRDWHHFLVALTDATAPQSEERQHALAEGVAAYWRGDWSEALVKVRQSYYATAPPGEQGTLTSAQAAAAAHLTLVLEAAISDVESRRAEGRETETDGRTLRNWRSERQELRRHLVRYAEAQASAEPSHHLRSPQPQPGLAAAWRLALLAKQRTGETDVVARWLPHALAATGDTALVRDLLANVRTPQQLRNLYDRWILTAVRESRELTHAERLLAEALALHAYNLGEFQLARNALDKLWPTLNAQQRHTLAPLRRALTRLH